MALAILCGALSLLILLPLGHIGKRSVALAVGSHLCGAPSCSDNGCTSHEWIAPDTLRVTTVVFVPFSREVESDRAYAEATGTSLRLYYFTQGRDFEKGSPVPACAMPVTLRFDVPGLQRQAYTVSTVETPRHIERASLAIGTALLLVPVLVVALALARNRKARPGHQP